MKRSRGFLIGGLAVLALLAAPSGFGRVRRTERTREPHGNAQVRTVLLRTVPSGVEVEVEEIEL